LVRMAPSRLFRAARRVGAPSRQVQTGQTATDPNNQYASETTGTL
jgi:hypothetical protein